MRGHIPGSRPLVLGSPPPGADEALGEGARAGDRAPAPPARHHRARAARARRPRRRHGLDARRAARRARRPPERLDPARRHGRRGRASSRRGRTSSSRCARRISFPTIARSRRATELAGRLDDAALTILDVRRDEEYTGKHGSACDPRQGHIPGARHVEVDLLFAAPGVPQPAGADPRARRRAGGRRGRRVLPLRLALGDRDARAAQCRLRRAQLRRARGTSGRGTTSFRSSASYAVSSSRSAWLGREDARAGEPPTGGPRRAGVL